MRTTTREIYGLEVEEVERDRLSSRIRCIRSKQPETQNFNELVQRGEAICEQVRYLNEDLRLLEADKEHDVVTLRSVEPDKEAREIRYFEMKLNQSGNTTLGRFKYDRDSGDREAIDFVIANDTLERLAKDLNP